MNDNKIEDKHYVHITSDQGWFELKLSEVWQYRDLIILLTKRSFQLAYKQTILGPMWVFLNPFITSVIFTFVFGGIAGIETDGIPHILFYLCSNAIWTFFSTSLTKNATTFTSNAAIFGKVYFPRLTIPISNVLYSIIQFCIQMTMVSVFLFYYIMKGKVSPNWKIWMFIPLILLHLGIMALAFGIIVSSVTTKYRDLAILVTFGVQLWMYITPIVYPLSQAGNGILKMIVLINPVTTPVEVFRYAVLGRGTIMPAYLALSGFITIVVALFGIMLFNHVERTFVDTV